MQDMTGVILILVMVGLAGLVVLSIRMNARPITLGEPRLVPWIPVGMLAAAVEVIVVAYALSYFGS